MNDFTDDPQRRRDASTATAAVARTQRRASAALWLLALGYFTLGTSSLSVVGIAPPMAKDLGVPEGRIGLLVTAFALVFAVVAPLAPTILRRLGRREVLVVGLVLLLAGNALAALANSYGMLFAARMLSGAGAAVYGPAASATGTLLVPPERQGRALAVVFGGMTVATVLGVPASTALSASIGWRAVLAALAALTLLVGVGVALLLPRLAAGVAPSPRTYRDVATTPGVSLGVLTTLAQLASQFVMYGVIAVFLTTRYDVASGQVAAALLLFGIFGVLGNSGAGWLLSRWSATRLVTISLVWIAVAYAALLLAPGRSWSAFVLLPVWAVASQMYQAPQQARMVSLRPDQRALVLALNASALYLGMSLGSALGSMLLGHWSASALPAVALAFALATLGAHLASAHAAGRPADTPPSPADPMPTPTVYEKETH